ncbi:MAG TPA: hypothetical protein VHQ87_14810 [Rhizobacter sp.]|nr:hypothetical protein [Rhizobacter sp.]
MIVRRFGVWRLASSLLVLAAAAAVGGWVYQVAESSAVLAGATLGLLVLSSAVILIQAWSLQPTSLRWDTQRWHLGSAASAGHEPSSGHLTVAMDWGMWMLLRFVPDERAAWQPDSWLPVQRGGHEAAWHALRSTVYCARPVSLPAVAPF